MQPESLHSQRIRQPKDGKFGIVSNIKIYHLKLGFTFLSMLKSVLLSSSIIGSSSHKISKQKPGGFAYSLYKAPTKMSESTTEIVHQKL